MCKCIGFVLFKNSINDPQSGLELGYQVGVPHLNLNAALGPIAILVRLNF